VQVLLRDHGKEVDMMDRGQKTTSQKGGKTAPPPNPPSTQNNPGAALRWAWLPAAMPGVARLMSEKRRSMGHAHVDECWRRGMAGEPGWLFAREGAVAIGTPWAGDPALENFALAQVTSTQALLVIRHPEVFVPAVREGVAHGSSN
jgi:hypothetical protein